MAFVFRAASAETAATPECLRLNSYAHRITAGLTSQACIVAYPLPPQHTASCALLKRLAEPHDEARISISFARVWVRDTGLNDSNSFVSKRLALPSRGVYLQLALA